MNVKIFLGKDGQMPQRQTPGSAGYDLHAKADYIIEPQNALLVGTDVFLEFSSDFEAQIRSRSGLAMKHKIMVLNSPGTIDSDYRGEIMVLLMNFGMKKFEITKGMRIAQIVFSRVELPKFEKVESLIDSDRSSGWGSTGV
jgi:dUTP pyrophosphatase